MGYKLHGVDRETLIFVNWGIGKTTVTSLQGLGLGQREREVERERERDRIHGEERKKGEIRM